MNDYGRAEQYIESLQLDSTRRPVVGFMILWMTYNNHFKDESGRSERDKFCNYFARTAADYVSENQQSIVRGFKQTSNPERTHVQDMRDGSSEYRELLDSQGDLTDTTLANVLYQIRCNLFHGKKDVVSLDERRLITWAYEILQDVIGAYQYGE